MIGPTSEAKPSRPCSKNLIELTNNQFDEVEIREVSYFGAVPKTAALR
jgi:hypothetical protein